MEWNENSKCPPLEWDVTCNSTLIDMGEPLFVRTFVEGGSLSELFKYLWL